MTWGMIHPVVERFPSLIVVLFVAACAAAPPPEPPAVDPNSPEARRVALAESLAAIEQHRVALAAEPVEGTAPGCDAIGERVASLWAATRRAAIEEAEKRAVRREGDALPPASKRREDDLLVNFRTDGYAELAALAYQLRWGGWHQAGSEQTLVHLVASTGVPLVVIQGSCNPATGEFTASADCHTKVALAASVLGLDSCS